MTFSANPARKSLRARLGDAGAPRRAQSVIVLTALGLMALGAALTFFLARAVTGEQAAQFGHALAVEAAQRAGEYLVHDDLVSLNVVTNGLARLPGIVGVTVYDRHRQPLAQSGQVLPTPGTVVTRALILDEDREERGSVELLLAPAEASPAMTRLYYAIGGWLGFSVALLLVVARLQRDAPVMPAAVAEPEPVHPADPAPEADDAAIHEDVAAAPDTALPAGALLRLEVVNLANLEQRLAPHLLAETLDWYDDVLARACAIYQGRLVRHVGDQCAVLFAAEPGQEEDAIFRAVCCAHLFFGVVRETAGERRAAGHMSLQFTAALHHDGGLDPESLALVTWEICTQAGIPGRLTVTDAISDRTAIGERLLVDGNHRHLLQIELPDADGQFLTQELVAFGIVRLADPWEELLARQVRRLCEPAAA